LRRHGNVAHTIGVATYISLIFPNTSIKENLKEVESSLLALIQHRTGKLRKLNKQNSTVPINGGEEIETIKDLFEKVEKYVY